MVNDMAVFTFKGWFAFENQGVVLPVYEYGSLPIPSSFTLENFPTTGSTVVKFLPDNFDTLPLPTGVTHINSGVLNIESEDALDQMLVKKYTIDGKRVLGKSKGYYEAVSGNNSFTKAYFANYLYSNNVESLVAINTAKYWDFDNSFVILIKTPESIVTRRVSSTGVCLSGFGVAFRFPNGSYPTLTLYDTYEKAQAVAKEPEPDVPEPDVPEPEPDATLTEGDFYRVINGAWVKHDSLRPMGDEWVKQDEYLY